MTVMLSWFYILSSALSLHTRPTFAFEVLPMNSLLIHLWDGKDTGTTRNPHPLTVTLLPVCCSCPAPIVTVMVVQAVPGILRVLLHRLLLAVSIYPKHNRQNLLFVI